jgi:AraC-like DNA-binding protein
MTPASGDFAASAMLRVIARGMALQGLRVEEALADAQTLLRTHQAARVPLEHKRALLRAIAQRHAPPLLLRLGQGVLDAPMEPALQALVLAASPVALIHRWQRLERFVHTRHRTRLLFEGPNRLIAQHAALHSEAPWAEEDALVLGVLVGLLQRMGYTTLRARFAGERSWRYDGGVWHDRALPRRTDRWELAWRAGTPAAAPRLPKKSTDLPQQIQALLAADLGRTWVLADVAQALGCAPRTLQRGLAQAATSFAQLLQTTRVAQASQWLTTGPHSISEIGYVCGYADQAHFTRAFKRHAGLTPLKYREQFRR